MTAHPAASSGPPCWIGSYSTADTTGSITAATVDPRTGALVRAGEPSAADNAGFLTRASSGIVYAVFENDSGEVGAFAPAADGSPRPLGPPRSTGGSYPCHLALDPSQRYVLVANYGSGSVTVHPIAADGSLAEATDTVQHHGSGADDGPGGRQTQPHAHMMISRPAGDGREEILVPDLGTDQIVRYRLDTEAGRLVPIGTVTMPPGSGPRHLAVRGRYAYVVGELDSTLSVVDLDGDATAVITTVSTVTDGQDSFPSAVRLSPDGRWCYVANRGPDTIAVLSVAGTELRLEGGVSTQGEWPRDLTLSADGQLMYVANQASDEVRAFRVDPRTGRPAPVGGPLPVSQPSCIVL